MQVWHLHQDAEWGPVNAVVIAYDHNDARQLAHEYDGEGDWHTAEATFIGKTHNNA